MALLDNLSFEVPGVGPGEADGWTVSSVSAVESLAVFTAGSEEAEDFEAGWDNDGYEFALASVLGAIFTGGAGYEAFDWPVPYYFELSGVEELPDEDFESGWDNDGYLFSLSSVEAAPVEDFESGWGNDSYDFVLGSTDTAQFDGASPEGVEDFEETWEDRRFEADASTDTLSTSAAHGFGNGDAVYFRTGAGALPSGLRVGYRYFARDVAPTTLKVAAFSGGAAVDLQDAGVGEVYLRGDVTLYWPLE